MKSVYSTFSYAQSSTAEGILNKHIFSTAKQLGTRFFFLFQIIILVLSPQSSATTETQTEKEKKLLHDAKYQQTN
jgi:hypothetical protein